MRHIGDTNSKATLAPIAVAIVHHANQYLITEGYDNREGILAVVGAKDSPTGLWRVLELHRTYSVPASLHISGTLIEAIAWRQPGFLHWLRELYLEGLLEFVGSCYGQNVMRFFSYEHNLQQLQEQLHLYRVHLGVEPQQVKTFWPPERVWDTERMAPVLRDPRLPNDGYEYVLIDDRLLLPANGASVRHAYDRNPAWDPQLLQAHRIRHGQGLVAVPIAGNLRQCIPPRCPEHWQRIESQLQWLSAVGEVPLAGDLIAVYADDMEKPAGVGWDSQGPSQFEAFLRWLRQTEWIHPVKLSEWAMSSRVAGTRTVETGTFVELANHFDAGENYEKWYYDSQWAPYRACYSWAESRVKELAALGADPSLLSLAEKHLLASSWETAWHTPSTGAHGNSTENGGPSPWIRALASHSRHAAVIAEAALWMRHRDDEAHAYLQDIDHDGLDELILKNDRLFAVFSPHCGGRLIFLFSLEGPGGNMVIGNPTDDWNLMEELNQWMDVPRNHPGALADAGFERDRYEASVIVACGQVVFARLNNIQAGSGASGLVKILFLAQGSNSLRLDYLLPESLPGITIEFGLSPDYLSLLRYGRCLLREYTSPGIRGWAAGSTAVWIQPDNEKDIAWLDSDENEFGHGRSLRLATSSRQLRFWIGAEALAQTAALAHEVIDKQEPSEIDSPRRHRALPIAV